MIAILFVATFFALVVKYELHETKFSVANYYEWLWSDGAAQATLAKGRWDDRANGDFWLLTSDYSS